MLLQWLIVFCGIIAFAAMAIQIFGATVYDIRDVARQRRYLLQPNARRYRHRPLISVIINSNNNQDDIVACLDSIVSSSYRKVQVIVVDSISTDGTKHIVQSYIKKHPTKNITLFARRTSNGLINNCVEAHKRRTNGEYIVLCQATDRFDPQAFSRAIRYCNDNESVEVVALNSQIIDQQSYSNVLHRYKSFMQRRHNKAADAYGHYVSGFQTGTMYASQTALHALRHPLLSKPTNFLADAYIFQQPAANSWITIKNRFMVGSRNSALDPNKSQTWQSRAARSISTIYRASALVAVAAAPGVVGYCLYLAISLRQPNLLLLIVSGTSLFVAHAIANDTAKNTITKIGYILGLPLIYGALIIVMAVASLLAISRIFVISQSSLKAWIIATKPTLYTRSST